jgi:hypothetical protein
MNDVPHSLPPERTKTPEDERAQIANDIGWKALELAKWARSADLPAVAYLLETAAMEAASQPSTGIAPRIIPNAPPKR